MPGMRTAAWEPDASATEHARACLERVCMRASFLGGVALHARSCVCPQPMSCWIATCDYCACAHSQGIIVQGACVASACCGRGMRSQQPQDSIVLCGLAWAMCAARARLALCKVLGRAWWANSGHGRARRSSSVQGPCELRGRALCAGSAVAL